MNAPGLTTIPTDDLKQLLRYLHQGHVTAPLTATQLACVGLQHRSEPLLAALRSLDDAGLRAVLVCVLAERLSRTRPS